MLDGQKQDRGFRVVQTADGFSVRASISKFVKAKTYMNSAGREDYHLLKRV